MKKKNANDDTFGDFYDLQLNVNTLQKAHIVPIFFLTFSVCFNDFDFISMLQSETTFKNMQA